MSEAEQDAIVGRLIREKADAKRRKALADAELDLVSRGMQAMFRELHNISTEGAAGRIDPFRKYFNVDAFLGLIKERNDAQSEVLEKIQSLRALGIE